MKGRYLISVGIIILAINATCLGMFFLAPGVPGKTGQVIEPTPTRDTSNYGGIQINGKPDFITQTRAALTLLEQKDPLAFKKVHTYIGIIEQGQHSGMWAWEQPPRYEVGDQTAFYSVTWYASTIAHDATHSELYAQYQAAHPGESVPESAYTGVDIERFCNSYQLDVLRRIGAPKIEIDDLRDADIPPVVAIATGTIIGIGIGKFEKANSNIGISKV